jgi:hypothetical protein
MRNRAAVSSRRAGQNADVAGPETDLLVRFAHPWSRRRDRRPAACRRGATWPWWWGRDAARRVNTTWMSSPAAKRNENRCRGRIGNRKVATRVRGSSRASAARKAASSLGANLVTSRGGRGRGAPEASAATWRSRSPSSLAPAGRGRLADDGATGCAFSRARSSCLVTAARASTPRRRLPPRGRLSP